MLNSVRIAAAALVILSAPAAIAQEEENFHHLGDLTIAYPWARAAAPGADTLAFFEIDNAGVADRLLSATTSVAADVEIVGLVLDGATIDMIPIGPIDLLPGVQDFDPGGLALELHGLTKALAMGEEFDLTLVFEHAGTITIPVPVEAAGAMLSSERH